MYDDAKHAQLGLANCVNTTVFVTPGLSRTLSSNLSDPHSILGHIGELGIIHRLPAFPTRYEK